MAEDLQMSWPTRGSEDVRGRDIDRVRSEAEAGAVLDDETGCLDRGERFASRVTSAGEERADRAICDALHAGRSSTFRDDVFKEAQFTTGADHAAEFGKRRRLIRYGTQHERRDTGVERRVWDGEGVRRAIEDCHLDQDRASRFFGLGAQERLGFDCDHLSHRARVVRKVQTVARPDFDHPAVQPCEQSIPVLARALRFGNVTKAFVNASEDRVVDPVHGLML
jgi:hypothetical protein